MDAFSAVASGEEVACIARALDAANAVVKDASAVDALGWQAIGQMHDDLQRELGGRQRRQLAGSYRADHLAGSRRWMIENDDHYLQRLEATAGRAAHQQAGLVADITARILANRPPDPTNT